MLENDIALMQILCRKCWAQTEEGPQRFYALAVARIRWRDGRGPRVHSS